MQSNLKSMKTILFILWMLCTIILTCTVIGMLLFIPDFADFLGERRVPSVWMQLGKDLLASILSKTK